MVRASRLAGTAVVAGFALLLLLGAAPSALGDPGTTEISTANGSTVCPTDLGGAWDGVSTCTITGTLVLGVGDTLQIDSGVTVVVNQPTLDASGGMGGGPDGTGASGNGAAYAFENQGDVINYGTLMAAGGNGGSGGAGVPQTEAIDCHDGAGGPGGGGGGGSGGDGIFNLAGTITNYGTLVGSGGTGGPGGVGGSLGSTPGGEGGAGGAANSAGANGDAGSVAPVDDIYPGTAGGQGGNAGSGGAGGDGDTSGHGCGSAGGGGGGGGGFDIYNAGTILNCGGVMTGVVTGAAVLPSCGKATTTTTTVTESTTVNACTATVTETLASTPEFSSSAVTMLGGVAVAFLLVALVTLRRRRGAPNEVPVSGSLPAT